MTLKENRFGDALPRRRFLSVGASAAALALTGCAIPRDPGVERRRLVAQKRERDTRYYRELYGPINSEQFPIPAVRLDVVKPKYWRLEVPNTTGEAPGTVVVNTKTFHLYFTQEDGTAMRYGVGLGRAGFEWSGRARVAWKRAWPKWTPPAEMIERQPELEKWSAANGGMPPGIDNPLGARALYIFEGGQDTLYRIHGSPEDFSIGRAVSSGCVRLLNHDIIDLYNRVPNDTPIVVI